MISPTPTRRLIRAVTASLAAAALLAGCSATASSTSTGSGAGAASKDAWTTISTSVRTASTGASVTDVLAANDAVAAVTTPADEAGTYDSGATTIALSGDSATVSGSGATVDGSTVTITSSGTYVVSGSLSDGQIVVNADDADVHLVLDGATITNADGPAVNVVDAGSVVVVLAAGSANSLSDGASYADTSDNAPTATLYSSDDLTITGTGSLSVTGLARDGISSKNGVVISGSPTVTVNAFDDGIRGKDYVAVTGGTLSVTAGGDGIKSSEDSDQTQGFVALGAAAVTVTAGDDGVSATTDVTVSGTTLSVTAGGGQAAASPTSGGPGQEAQPPSGARAQQSAADQGTEKPKGVNAGVSYTQDSGTVVLDAADEGLQSAFINISGGELTVTSGDDGVNATNGDHVIEGYENADSESDDGAVLTITGGTTQISYAGSDGIDSNGSAFITGGTVLISGTAGSMDGSVDVNGESTTVGVTDAPGVAVGDTVTVTGGSGSQTLTSTISASTTTVLGLVEGESYTVSTSSGGSRTLTASALAAGAGGPGGPGGPGQGGAGQGAPGGPGQGQGQPPAPGQNGDGGPGGGQSGQEGTQTR
jgi:hypothetical protein avisC_06003